MTSVGNFKSKDSDDKITVKIDSYGGKPAKPGYFKSFSKALLGAVSLSLLLVVPIAIIWGAVWGLGQLFS